jgi:hypothetical protein
VPKKSLLAVPVLALFVSSLAHAGVVVSFPPNQSGASDLNSFLEADDFFLPAPTVITQIQFWALQNLASDYAGSVDWALYSDLAGAPNVALASGNASPVGVATGQSAFGLNEFSYSFAVNANLNTGTYWLVLHNGPSNAIPATNFYWEWSNGNAGNSLNQDLLAPGWVPNEAELAFQVSGSVPEPVSMSLVGCGMIAGWLLRRKQKGARS